eukprot:1154279-Pelagomonas_calceolata.AAC.7
MESLSIHSRPAAHTGAQGRQISGWQEMTKHKQRPATCRGAQKGRAGAPQGVTKHQSQYTASRCSARSRSLSIKAGTWQRRDFSARWASCVVKQAGNKAHKLLCGTHTEREWMCMESKSKKACKHRRAQGEQMRVVRPLPGVMRHGGVHAKGFVGFG